MSDANAEHPQLPDNFWRQDVRGSALGASAHLHMSLILLIFRTSMAGHERLSVVSLSHLDSPAKWEDFAETLSRKLLSPSAGSIVVDYHPFVGDTMTTAVVTTSISSNHCPSRPPSHSRSSSKKLRAACMRVLDAIVHGFAPQNHQHTQKRDAPTYRQISASYSTAAVAPQQRQNSSLDGDFAFPLRRSSTTRGLCAGKKSFLAAPSGHSRHDSGIDMAEPDRPDSPTLVETPPEPSKTDLCSADTDGCSICSSIESLEVDFEKQSRDSGVEMGEKVLVAQVVQILRAARKSIYPQRTPPRLQGPCMAGPGGFF